MNMSLGYFHRKIEEKRIESKEIPSCLIPCLLVLFCSDSVWYQKKFFPLFVTLVFSQIWKGRILASSQQILMLSKNNFRQSMLHNGPCGRVLTNNSKVFPLVLFLDFDSSYNCYPCHSKMSYSAGRIYPCFNNRLFCPNFYRQNKIQA